MTIRIARYIIPALLKLKSLQEIFIASTCCKISKCLYCGQGCWASCQVNKFSNRSRYMTVDLRNHIYDTISPLSDSIWSSEHNTECWGALINIITGLWQEYERIMDYISTNLHSWMSTNPLTPFGLRLKSRWKNLISLPARCHIKVLHWIEISYLCFLCAAGHGHIQETLRDFETIK